MQKNYTNQLIGLIMLFMLGGSGLLQADCTYSNLTLDQVTQNNNGGYDITMTFCATGGYDGCTDITGAFGFFVEGGAKIIGYPASMTSPQTGSTYSPQLFDYNGISDVVVYHDFGQYIWWTCVDQNCGPLVPVCSTITITTDILPSKIICGGMEGQGVLVAPYCCTGPDLEVFPDPNFPPPPCYYFDLEVDLGDDVDVMYSYQGSECTSISANTIGSGTLPYSYAWSNGATASSINVCPSTTTNYSVTITDGEGCTTTDDMTVNVQDIFCGNNKIYMCKPNGTTTRCIKLNKVQQKLNNGWTLGPCGSSNITIDETIFENLSSDSNTEDMDYRKSKEQITSLYLYTIDGILVDQMKNPDNGTSDQLLRPQNLPSGIYIQLVRFADGTVESKKVYIF